METKLAVSTQWKTRLVPSYSAKRLRFPQGKKEELSVIGGGHRQPHGSTWRIRSLKAIQLEGWEEREDAGNDLPKGGHVIWGLEHLRF